nr:hypothetical protein OG461_04530 [Streptomyces sp. NBC_00995]
MGDLAESSRGTETYGVATIEGIDVFPYWRDGECVEYCEPGTEHSRSAPLGAAEGPVPPGAVLDFGPSGGPS